ESSLSADLETELQQTRQRLTALTERVAALAQTSREAESALQSVSAQAEHERREVQTHQTSLRAATDRLAELNEEIAADKTQHLEQMRRSAHLQNEAVASKAHVDNLARERDRLRQRSDLAATSLASLDVELQELLDAESQLLGRLQAARQRLADNKQ